jgi:hypothetical protein
MINVERSNEEICLKLKNKRKKIYELKCKKVIITIKEKVAKIIDKGYK